MAAAIIGSAFLSATVQTLVEKLASKEFLDYIKKTKLDVSLLRQLQTTLVTLEVVLDDAEEKQINNLAIKQWLDDLKDTVFDAEDLLNDISYDSLRCKVESSKAANKTNKVWNFISSPFKNIYGEINSQMKIMCERLQLFGQHKDILGLQTKGARVSHRTPSSSMVNESVMVGRKDDKETIMNMLLSERDTTSNKIGVVAILGMGGLGKTTLAQLIYNDKEVQQHFDLKAWVCVSADFDIMRVTKSLLESITCKTWKSKDLDFLQVELNKNLREKRCLLVLDDLWNDNYNDWDELVKPFIDGKPGSSVIITTRQQNVAEVTHTFPIHKLQPLSEDESWSLLSKHALGSDDFHDIKNTMLETIGRKIARKCGGLPIAAKTLGGILRSKVDTREWNAILNSDVWHLPNNGIMPALHLSYQYLPSHLKRCFAYCSIFPKDNPLDRTKLVLLWMAEGFIDSSQGRKQPEEVGNDFFVELLSRSLIQESNDDNREKHFFMHDLVNDLATFVSGKSCGRLESGDIHTNVRHLSYNQEEYDIFKKFENFYDYKCLRSFLSITSWRTDQYLSFKLVDDLLPTFNRLRVLSLSKYKNITKLPDSFGSLVQLRYVDLSLTKIKSLPDTTCNLYNLQTLILSDCEKLTELPIHMKYLICLRHLDISRSGIDELPMEICRLENLHTLTVFLVGKQHVGLSIKEVRKFSNVHGKLTIKNLHNVINATEAEDANLKNKEKIEELELVWGIQSEDSLRAKVVLDMLQPSINLQGLKIDLYVGTSFPSWLENSSFSNIVSLHICNCKYCMTLPPLGQLPSLKDLIIEGMLILETIGSEFYCFHEGEGYISSFQPFPSLEHVEFRNMSNWTEWLPFEGKIFAFPRLKTLKLCDSPELRRHLLSHLSSIEEVIIEGCDNLLETPHTLHWLSSIKSIQIERCVQRAQWPLILSSTCLQHLKLNDIPSLTAFPTDGLPTSLQTLYIRNCKKLSFMAPETWSKYTSLTQLSINKSCNELTSFQLDGFPALQRLYVGQCKSLDSIYILEGPASCPSSLKSLTIISVGTLCVKLRMDTLTALEQLNLVCQRGELSFCEGVYLPPKLQSIMIHLSALSPLIMEWCLQCLTALLRFIGMSGDDKVNTLMKETFLPISFVFFIMYLSRRTMTPPITEWGFQRLTALSRLSIRMDDDKVNTLMKKTLLPISLVTLNIYEMNSFDGNGLRHLSSLEYLGFQNCHQLESLPENCLPSSLKTLDFWKCERLESLPEDSFPDSLQELFIKECPLLEERYKRKEHWSKIAHIPVIKINGQVTI